MGKNIFETLMGAVVLVVAVGFIFIAYSGGKVDDIDGYILKARFDRVDGLSVGSDVRISGLRIGKVLQQTLDPKTYQAVVIFEIADEVQIPKGSGAEIIGDGLLGSKYLALIPGGGMDMFKPGEEIIDTQPSISIESLIAKMMFSSADSTDGASGSGGEKDEDDVF